MINCLSISILKPFVISKGLKIDNQNIYYFKIATINNLQREIVNNC